MNVSYFILLLIALSIFAHSIHPSLKKRLNFCDVIHTGIGTHGKTGIKDL